MIDAATVRAVALALPEAIEHDHHGRPSFRVAGKIFATLWDAGHANVMLDQPGILTAVRAHPEACAEFWWGRRLAAVQLDLGSASAALLADLLADAWSTRRPRACSLSAPLTRSSRPLTGARIGRTGRRGERRER